MGEQLRSHIAASRAAHLPYAVIDIFGYSKRTDPEHRALLADAEIEVCGEKGIRVFHINGDEVQKVLEAFSRKGNKFRGGYNIIVPAWELPIYPKPWADKLKEFDEVWALSKFIKDSLAAAGIDSHYIGQSAELKLGYFLPRQYFGIRESAFVFLHFLDFSSYSSRKNPKAIIELFRRFRSKHPLNDIQLILKAKNGDVSADDRVAEIAEAAPDSVLITNPLSTLETRSLINSCDCFISLHRSEGFGRGTAEAMYLGKLAMATGWSGNLDHMSPNTSLLVGHRLVPITEGEYPFGGGQEWAEPDLDHALYQMERAVLNNLDMQDLATRGQRDVRLRFSHRSIGLRISERLNYIGSTKGRSSKPPSRARRRNQVLLVRQQVPAAT